MVTKTEYQQVYLPGRFLIDCPVPKWGGGDFREIGKHAVRLKAAMEACNVQLREARTYQESARRSEADPGYTSK